MTTLPERAMAFLPVFVEGYLADSRDWVNGARSDRMVAPLVVRDTPFGRSSRRGLNCGEVLLKGRGRRYRAPRSYSRPAFSEPCHSETGFREGKTSSVDA